MKLAELSQLFWAAMRAEPPPPEVDAEFLGTPRIDARARLEIYRRMYWYRQVDAMFDGFPALARMLGDQRFTRQACDYIAAHPSEHPALEWLGARFPAFLRRASDPLASAGADLAALEWARSQAFLAPNAAALASARDIPIEAFAAARLSFVPALFVVEVSRAACAQWERHARGGEPVRAARPDAQRGNVGPADPAPVDIDPVDAELTTVATWRRGFAVEHAPLEPRESEALAVARAGAPMAAVCACLAAGEADPVAAAFGALGRWLARQWVAAIVPADAEGTAVENLRNRARPAP